MFDLENAAEQLKKVINTVYVIANVCTIILGIVLIIAGFASGDTVMGIVMLFIAPIFVVISILLTKLMLLQSYMICEQAEDVRALKDQFCALSDNKVHSVIANNGINEKELDKVEYKPSEEEINARLYRIDLVLKKDRLSEEDANNLKELAKTANNTDFSNAMIQAIRNAMDNSRLK